MKPARSWRRRKRRSSRCKDCSTRPLNNLGSLRNLRNLGSLRELPSFRSYGEMPSNWQAVGFVETCVGTVPAVQGTPFPGE